VKIIKHIVYFILATLFWISVFGMIDRAHAATVNVYVLDTTLSKPLDWCRVKTLAQLNLEIAAFKAQGYEITQEHHQELKLVVFAAKREKKAIVTYVFSDGKECWFIAGATMNEMQKGRTDL